MNLRSNIRLEEAAHISAPMKKAAAKRVPVAILTVLGRP